MCRCYHLYPCFQLLGGLVCAGAIYIMIDKTFVCDMFANQLLYVSAWMIIIPAGLIFIISMVGCYGGLKRARTVLMVVRMHNIIAL